MSTEFYYGNVTEKEFRDGERYAEILAERYANRLPTWADRDALQAAARDGLLHAARNFNRSKGYVWSTYLHPAILSRLSRENTANLNWYMGQSRYSHNNLDFDQHCMSSLDFLIKGADTEGDELSMAGLLAAADDVERQVVEARWYEQVLDLIHPSQRAILHQRLHGATLEECKTGRQGSREAVRQALNVALRDLREAMECNGYF